VSTPHRRCPTLASRARGFTLVELVVAMSVSVVVVSFVAMFMARPVAGFADQSRRAKLVDAADTALRRMSRDVRRALPNSIRMTTNGAVVALELLGSIDGARYRAQPPGSVDQILDFTAADVAFNSVGPFTQVTKPFSSTSAYLSIYNVGVPGADAYELGNVITPPGTRIDIATDAVAGEDRVTLTPGYRFAFESPTQRMFLVEGPISYLCDTGARTLRRYSGYTIAPSQASRDSAAELLGAGATATLMADRVAACTITYAPGTAERAGLVSMEVRIAEQGETISLLAQAHVDNVP
jgi:MSHA biogenesis protein MshO